ncbi:MAG: response regulator [Rickettsiales bacterium]|nr:response regulator [Rickettsiales bacterium]
MKTCMVVDDSKIVRKVTRRMLESLHYHVVEAEQGEEALSVFSQHHPSLILLDWHMPVMDGLAFIKVLRGGSVVGGEKPIVIFCTTETDISNIQEAIVSGANEYVMKPFDEDILKGKLLQLGVL